MTEYSIILEHVFEHKKTRCSSRTVFLAQGELFRSDQGELLRSPTRHRCRRSIEIYPALISFYVFFSILELLQNTLFCGNTDRHAAKFHKMHGSLNTLRERMKRGRERRREYVYRSTSFSTLFMSNYDWKSNPGDFRLSDGCFSTDNKPHCGSIFPQLRVVPYFPREVAAIHGDIASTKIFPRRARRVNRTFDNGRWREKEGACERANERARDDLATAPSRSAGIEFQAPEGQKRGRTDRRGPFSFV